MNTNTLPFHRHLRHPRTGQRVQAIGRRRNGSLVWPIMGADENDPDSKWSEVFPDKTPEEIKAALDAKATENDESAWAKLFPDATPEDIKKAVDESRKWEGRAKGNKTKADQLDALAKLISGENENEPDPAKLAGDLTAAQREARATKVENAVLKRASKVDADPALLADSRSFMDSISDLDPADDDFATKLDAAIKKAVEDNSALKVAPATGPRPARQQGNPSEGKQGGVQAGAELFKSSRPASKSA